MSNYYMQGVRAAQSYHSAHGYGFERNVRGEDVIKMYLPPVEEYMTQMASPMPKPRRDWIRGFEEEQAAIFDGQG